jgi:hypothetical protein
MRDETLYAVCICESVVYNWGLATSEGKPTGITKRRFVDIEVQRFRNELGLLIEVRLKDFIADMEGGIFESKYAKMLGWNYGVAAELVRAEGVVFIALSGQNTARAYSYCSTRDDDDYALQLIHDLYSVTGGQFILEEFDPEKHILGYKPKIEKPRINY